LSPSLPANVFPALLELLPSGVVYYLPVTDATGTVVDFTFAYLNPAAQQLLRLPAHPTVTYTQHFTQADSEGLAFHRAAYQQAAPAHRTGYYQAEGYDAAFTMQAQRVNDALLVHFTLDAADRPAPHAQEQATRQAMQTQRDELARLFEQAPAAIAVYRGPNYTIELANSTVARLWGRTQEQLIGKGLFEALPEVAGMGYEALLDGVMATGTPYVAHAMEAQHDRNGQRETVYWDFVYVPVHAADGNINGAMVVATEVTQQVRARQQVEHLNQELENRVRERTRQLSEQQQLLSRILGQVPAAIATMSGPEHRYTFFNHLYQDQVNHRAVLGKTVAEALPEVVDLGFTALLDRVYATGELYEGREVPFHLHAVTADGHATHYINFVYQPLKDGQGQTTGVLVFALDVTEQVLAQQLVEHSQRQVQSLNEELAAINEELRATNEELHTSNAQLLRTNTDLDTFVYTASHDLKAPIANIEGLVHALQRNLPAPVLQEALVARLLALMQGAVSRFQQTIGHLTNIAQLHRLEAPEAVDLATLVADVQLDMASLVEATGARLTVQTETCELIHVAPKTLRSVLYNLLSNALKYRAPDRAPQVHVRVHCLSDQVIVQVQDNGLGLSEDQQARLFGLFRRLHTHVEGSGVGLYTVKRLVENVGGTISVQSQLDVGSIFTVSLPL